MRDDFSIEMSADMIVDRMSKDYFFEVMSSYNSGNYRSAIVMLWSVVICDILFKLDKLQAIHGDTTAKGIIDSIENRRSNNYKSSEWELFLLDEIYKRTDLINDVEYSNLKNLQIHRHLSAHPVITAEEVLYSPNRDTARAHIRNALEAVLTKPPILTKKVIEALIEDIASRKAVLPDERSLKTYLEAKYFPHLSPNVENSLFRSLWKLVFRLNNDDCNNNRKILYLATKIIYRRRVAQINEIIKNEQAYYCELCFDGDVVRYFLKFLGENPDVFMLLNDAARTQIINYANINLDHFACAWFLSENTKEHIKKVRERVEGNEGIGTNAYTAMCDSVVSGEEFGEVLDIGIISYGKSGSFNIADIRFTYMIEPLLDRYEEKHFINLMEAIKGNRQTHGRGQASRDHGRILDEIKKKFGDDLSKYQEYSGYLPAGYFNDEDEEGIEF